LKFLKRWFSKAIALLFVVVGLIWLLQGIDMLKMSFMSGEPFWAVIGGIAFFVGVGFFIYVWRKRPQA
jgi:predicted membrane channel-forming protein YqfA (hemolysin III family)